MAQDTRLEAKVQDAFTWLEDRTISIIRFAFFVLTLPQRVLPTLIHVAAFTTILPVLLAISLGAGFTVLNMIPEGWSVNLWMQYGEQAAPFARTVLPSLTPNQPYDIYLSLDVPITPENLALGNFMTKLVLTDARNVTVVSANRPALVLQKTQGWIPFMSSNSGIETINVPLVESWAPLTGSGPLSNPNVAIARGLVQKGYHAFISVGRPDSWRGLGNGQGRELSIARATLYGRVKLSGLRGFFARHRILLFSLSSATFFAASSGAALALYLLFAPDLSGELSGQGAGGEPQERGIQTKRRMREGGVKKEETEPPSASETDYTYTSGGVGSMKAESEDDSSF